MAISSVATATKSSVSATTRGLKGVGVFDEAHLRRRHGQAGEGAIHIPQNSVQTLAQGSAGRFSDSAR